MTDSSIYWGRVGHTRFLPKVHRFNYRVMMFDLYLDELDELARDYWAFRVQGHVTKEVHRKKWDDALPWRFVLRRSDFLPTYDGTLEEAARALHKELSGTEAPGRISMMANLRSMNWNFNPITLYFYYNGDRIERVIAEVTNTPWGERHCYLLNAPGTTHFAKAHHVSPFLEMAGNYELTYEKSGDKFTLEMGLFDIDAHDPTALGPRRLTAAMNFDREDLNDSSLHGATKRFPDMAFRVSLRIYVQAAKIFAKGMKYVAHPNAKRKGS